LWTIEGQTSGHISGKEGENFPQDLTAAFSWPPDDPKDEYIAYLFKRNKFCKRPKKLKSGTEVSLEFIEYFNSMKDFETKSLIIIVFQCDEWIDNKVLFGCYGATTSPSNDAKPDTSNQREAEPKKAMGSAKQMGSSSAAYSASFASISFAFALRLKFHFIIFSRL
jgi:hypothetical protein